MANKLKTPIIIDNGSYTCKAGFANIELPSYVCPTIIGRQGESIYIGNEVKQKRNILNNIQHPIEFGLIKNWDDIEKIWNHIFTKLNVDSKEQAVLLTETASNLKDNREKMAQIMFETFETPAVYIAKQAILSLISSGRLTGTVFQSGDGWSEPVCVYDGYVRPDSLLRFSYSGHDLTQYLKKLLNDKGYSCNDEDILRDIKEKLCYIALDFEKELLSPTNTTYELPDGQIIKLDQERFKCGESLFKPELINMEVGGITETIYNSIMKCDSDKRKHLFSNILLSGGNTMFPNIAERLHKEIIQMAPDSMNVKIIAPSNRNISAWIGGSYMAQLNSFKDLYITQSDYEEFGFNIIHKKCA